jgi:hypothetical protein
MDFDKPPHAVSPMPASEPLGPADDDETGPGSDFFVWRNTIGPADSTAPSCPNPMTVQAPGIDTGTSLAAQLNWRVLGKADHQQVEIKVGESVISVDPEMAALVQLLNKAGIATATSCVGSIRTSAYIMLLGTNSAERFLQIWHRYLVPLGHPMPELEFTARDEEWRVEIGSEFPFPQAVPVDSAGLTSTCVWREHREDMIEILPKLLWALRRHLGEFAERKRLNLQS